MGSSTSGILLSANLTLLGLPSPLLVFDLPDRKTISFVCGNMEIAFPSLQHSKISVEIPQRPFPCRLPGLADVLSKY